MAVHSDTVALITCTADQPTGLAMLERMMAEQTAQLDPLWVVIDDGEEPCKGPGAAVVLRRKREPDCSPAQSLARNLKVALTVADAPWYALIEHDDYYGPRHLEQLAEVLAGRRDAAVAGAMERVYYHVGSRQYRSVNDGAPALCQMGFTRAARGTLLDVARDMEEQNWWGLDREFWRRVPAEQRVPLDEGSVVGIKGLPGRPGIGYGHRPPKSWAVDDDGSVLRGLVGAEYAAVYSQFDTRSRFRMHRYASREDYVRAQVAANAKKINEVWARERTITEAAAYIAATVPPPLTFGLCHGTRRGREQEWFRRTLGIPVIGTEIAPTATQFPNTIQWDFHDVKPEWIGAADFIYSNSFDHSFDPRVALKNWMWCLKPGGVCIIEHSPAHGPAHVSASDPFGAEVAALPALINEWGGGQFRVVDVLQAPWAKITGTTLTVVANRKAG